MNTIFGWSPMPAGSRDLRAELSHQGQVPAGATNVFYGKRPLIEQTADGARVNLDSVPADIDTVVVAMDDGTDRSVIAELSRSEDGRFELD